MTKTITIITASTVCAGLLFLGFAWHLQKPRTVSKAHIETVEERETGAAVAVNQPIDVGALPQQVYVPQATPPSPPKEKNTPDEDTNAEEPMSPEEVAIELDAAFAADPPPDVAATRTASNVLSAFRSVQAEGANLRSIDCRRTRCKLTVDFNNIDADKKVMGDIFKTLATSGVDVNGLGFIVPTRDRQADGSIAATVHLYRVL
jgi:hypothetical protein